MHAALLLGDRYEIGPLIGRGGMADVFRARDLVTGGDVAVKLFRPGYDLAESRRHRRRELTMLASLKHHGLVSVLDVEAGDGPNSDALYLVVELVEGPTLRERIAACPLDDDEVGVLGAALCDAVAYMHRQGVVHRDIKPANVLLGSHAGWSQPKLTDFGIARMVDSTRMTADGLTKGTANYLSPEQTLASDVGMPSDVYSLGLVLLESLTGAVVFPGHGVEAALARLHRQPQIPSRINPRLADLLRRMTARDPADRPTAEQAGSELAVIADPSLASDVLALGRDAGDLPTQVIRTGTRRRKQPVVAFAAAFAVAAAAVSIWAVSSPHSVGDETGASGGPATSSASTSTAAPVASPASAPTSAADHVVSRRRSTARATGTPPSQLATTTSRSRATRSMLQNEVAEPPGHDANRRHRDAHRTPRHGSAAHHGASHRGGHKRAKNPRSPQKPGGTHPAAGSPHGGPPKPSERPATR